MRLPAGERDAQAAVQAPARALPGLEQKLRARLDAHPEGASVVPHRRRRRQTPLPAGPPRDPHSHTPERAVRQQRRRADRRLGRGEPLRGRAARAREGEGGGAGERSQAPTSGRASAAPTICAQDTCAHWGCRCGTPRIGI